MLLDGIEWKTIEVEPVDDGLPYATHEGSFELFGQAIRCYRLNDGKAVFHADDFRSFLSMWLEPHPDAPSNGRSPRVQTVPSQEGAAASAVVGELPAPDDGPQEQK